MVFTVFQLTSYNKPANMYCKNSESVFAVCRTQGRQGSYVPLKKSSFLPLSKQFFQLHHSKVKLN